MAEEHAADVLIALANPIRRRIVESLLGESLEVASISDKLGIRSYNASKHLACLRKAEIVEVKIARKQRIYSIASELQAGLLRTEPALDFGWAEFAIDGFIRNPSEPPQ